MVQKQAASSYVAQLNKAGYWKKPIGTEARGCQLFPAERYHQDFMAKNPNHPDITTWDKPKVANRNRLFPASASNSGLHLLPDRRFLAISIHKASSRVARASNANMINIG